MKIALLILIFFSIIGTLLPIWNNPHWLVRGQMNFRLIYFILNLILLGVLIGTFDNDWYHISAAFLLIISIFISLRSILPYLKIYPVEVHTAQPETPGDKLSILISNVFQYNSSYQDHIDQISSEDPDIVLLLETNAEWYNALEDLKKKYPYELKAIREDTYGMIFWSKYEIQNGSINYLVSKDIPSVDAKLAINKQSVRVIGIHPKPPVPGEAETSKPKDKEILCAAKNMRKNQGDHEFLIGDLNEVSWSRTSRTFKKITGMKDPRVGRGLFNTFPANLFPKFPLDQVFCSPTMELIDFKILSAKGSDHHPVYIKVLLR